MDATVVVTTDSYVLRVSNAGGVLTTEHVVGGEILRTTWKAADPVRAVAAFVAAALSGRPHTCDCPACGIALGAVGTPGAVENVAHGQ